MSSTLGKKLRILLAVAACVTIVSPAASGAELEVLVPNNLKQGISLALQAFEKSSGHKVRPQFASSRALISMVQDAAKGDVIILRLAQVSQLKKAGIIHTSPTPNIAKVGIGIAVRKGASKPDVSSIEKLKAALTSAKTVGYSDPQSGFLGRQLERSFQKLGLMPSLNKKKRTFPPGNSLWKEIESGQVELGFGPISAIAERPGLEFVGAVPAEIQSFNQFTAGIPKSSKNIKAATELIDFLQSPEIVNLLRSKGLVAE